MIIFQRDLMSIDKETFESSIAAINYKTITHLEICIRNLYLPALSLFVFQGTTGSCECMYVHTETLVAENTEN